MNVLLLQMALPLIIFSLIGKGVAYQIFTGQMIQAILKVEILETLGQALSFMDSVHLKRMNS